jgi:signal transduction histidine kinase
MEISDNQKVIVLILGGTFAIILFIVAIILFFIAHQRKMLKTQLLFEKQNSDNRLQMITNINETQELERMRIARSVHDDIVSLLFLAKMTVGQIQISSDENIKELAKESENLIILTMNEIRKTINSLKPSLLEKFGLIDSIYEMIRIMKLNSSIVFNFDHDDSYKKFDEKSELAVYRVIQELLTNAAKHSKAKNVDITFKQSNENIEIIVKDNGIGFDIHQKTKSLGLGLKNIENRIFLINGIIKYTTIPENGTTCTIKIPI